MAKEHDFIRIDVKAEIAKNIARLKAAQPVTTTEEEGLIPPAIDALMEQGFSLAEALAIIAEWYLQHPEYQP